MRKTVLPAMLLLILALLLAFPGHAADQDDDACLRCHARGGVGSALHIDEEQYSESVHGQEVACLECHPSADDDSHMKNKSVTSVDCGNCHEQDKNHGAGASGAVACFACHGAHNVFPADDPRSTLNVANQPATCGQCHPEEAGGKGFVSSLLSFRIKGHGKGSLAIAYSEKRCVDCHQGAAAHGEDVALSDADCYQCHGAGVGGNTVFGNIHSAGSVLLKRPDRALGDVLYLTFLLGFAVIFLYGWTGRIRRLCSGKPEKRWNNPLLRLKGFWDFAVAQKKVFRRKLAGRSHLLLFVGVLAPLLVIVIIQTNVTGPNFISAPVSFLLDLIGAGLLAGVVLAVARRIAKPKEFPHEGPGVLIGLALLALIGLLGFCVEGYRLEAQDASFSLASPVGSLFAAALPFSGVAVKAAWRFHFLLVLAFLALTPFTRLRHLLTAPLNIYFRNLGPMGRLRPIPVDQGARFGMISSGDLSWKGLLDLDACVSCGRCQEVCPANQAEKPLSPMKVIRDMKKASDLDFSAQAGQDAPFIGPLITPEEIWACTTCSACQEACPVFVEHVDKIVGMRRALALDMGEIPKEAARTLRNLEIFGDPSGYGPALRRNWFKSLDPSLISLEDKSKTMLWVGCQSGFHPRAQQIAQACLKIAARAGIVVGLLAEEEMCCGDPARRLGQEDLYQSLALKNIESLRRRGASTVITICPHCYNTLRNEYPDFGARFETLSSVEWILKLLREEKLEIKRGAPWKATFHDPCYLSRINGQSSLAREIVSVFEELEFTELEKHGPNTFCCGAGGGRVWLHEEGLRVNQVRAGQVAESGAEVVTTSCPYCVTMLEDGLSGLENGRQTKVFDLLEILEWVTR